MTNSAASSEMRRPYKGQYFPWFRRCSTAMCQLDLDVPEKRAVDCMIDAQARTEALHLSPIFQSNGRGVTDAENAMATVLDAVLGHVAGRVPVIVTTTHFASHICAERSKRAQALQLPQPW